MEAVDLLLAELREFSSGRLYFRIVHQFRMPGTDCMPGEEILAILLVHRSREYQLRLSPAQLLVADYLLRHSRYAQSASQIATGIHADGFYSGHGTNGAKQRVRRIPRSALKEYIKRIQRALALSFQEAGLHVEPCNVLVSEESVSNHILYRLRAIVEVNHIDCIAADTQPIAGKRQRATPIEDRW